MKEASRQEWLGAEEVLRKVVQVAQFHYEKLRKELIYPPEIQKKIRDCKELVGRWNDCVNRGEKRMITVAEVMIFTTLAQYLVAKFHEINGTEAPDVSYFSELVH